jgi:hypothetical protein
MPTLLEDTFKAELMFSIQILLHQSTSVKRLGRDGVHKSTMVTGRVFPDGSGFISEDCLLKK